MKENNGHGARRKCLKKLAWMSTVAVAVALLTLLTTTLVLHHGAEKSRRTSSMTTAFDQMAAKVLRHHRKAKQHDTTNRDGVAPAAALGISQSQLDAILNAHVHLIDLTIRTGEIARHQSQQGSGSGGSGSARRRTSRRRSNRHHRRRLAESTDEEGENENEGEENGDDGEQDGNEQDGGEEEDEGEEDESEEDESESSSTTIIPPYVGVYGTFCRLDWSLHKNNPSTYPMFRDLVAASKGCHENGGQRIDNVNLYDIAQLARQYDETSSLTKVLDLAGAVFHESRCGSTLVANLLAAIEPQQHRVYSESTPPIRALYQVCGDDYRRCSLDTAAAVLRDVVYMMSRTNDVNEERVFFKIQSAGSRNLPVFTHAFPTTPYLFVYREPVQVMMSHLKQGVKSANCVRERHAPPSSVQAVIDKYTPAHHHNQHVQHVQQQQQHLTTALAPEHYCAAHLASITETVVSHITSPYGVPVNYADLTTVLYSETFPQWLHVETLSDAQKERCQAVAGVYSKNRGGNRVVGEFQSDSAQKEQTASATVREAANLYLLPSYIKLEQLSEQSRSLNVARAERQQRH